MALITDEAVEAAAEKLYEMTMSNQALTWAGKVHHPNEQREPSVQALNDHEEIKERFRERASAALTAAEPYIGCMDCV